MAKRKRAAKKKPRKKGTPVVPENPWPDKIASSRRYGVKDALMGPATREAVDKMLGRKKRPKKKK